MGDLDNGFGAAFDGLGGEGGGGLDALFGGGGEGGAGLDALFGGGDGSDPFGGALGGGGALPPSGPPAPFVAQTSTPGVQINIRSKKGGSAKGGGKAGGGAAGGAEAAKDEGEGDA